MRRLVPPLLAVIALGLVVWFTIDFAGTVDSTAVGRSRTVIVLPTPPPVPDAPTATCTITDSSASTTSLMLSGSCAGEVAGEMRCTIVDESLGGSLSITLTDQRQLTLTVLVPEYDGPGGYEGAGVFAQVANETGAQRWSQRELDVQVSGDDVVRLEEVDLDPEPGTGTVGSLQLSGNVACDGPPAD